jgi:hypothetical protein
MRSIILVLFCTLILTAACSAQKQPDASQQRPLTLNDVLGEWFGESKCTGNNPYCHDEVVRYRFSEIKGEAGKVHLAADKKVNGEWDLMGEFDFTIDADKRTLTAEFKIPRTGGKGVWTFPVKDNTIDGILTVYPENEIGRKVHVEKKPVPTTD